MANGIDWFRWHHGSVTDPKFQLVAKRSGASLPAVLAIWAYVLEQASASESRGTFTEIDCEAVDCLFGLDDGATTKVLEAMMARDLIGIDRVVSWDKRQPKREREDDKSTDRVKAFRERQRQQEPSEAMKRHETPVERQETPRGEESREEVIQDPPPPSGGVPPAESRQSPDARASRLSSDWTLPSDWADWARQARPDLDPCETAEQFRDFWCAKPGKDGRKLDWLATWRNWVRGQRMKPGATQAAVTVPCSDTRAEQHLSAMAERAAVATRPPAEVLALVRKAVSS